MSCFHRVGTCAFSECELSLHAGSSSYNLKKSNHNLCSTFNLLSFLSNQYQTPSLLHILGSHICRRRNVLRKGDKPSRLGLKLKLNQEFTIRTKLKTFHTQLFWSSDMDDNGSDFFIMKVSSKWVYPSFSSSYFSSPPKLSNIVPNLDKTRPNKTKLDQRWTD